MTSTVSKPAQHALKSKGGLGRLLPALRYACQGLQAAWRQEAAFRQEIVIGIVLLIALPWIAPSLLHGILMAASILLVWCMELVNSAIEALADAVSVEHNILLGRAKDIGSAGVLLSIGIAAIIWVPAVFLLLRSSAA